MSHFVSRPSMQLGQVRRTSLSKGAREEDEYAPRSDYDSEEKRCACSAGGLSQDSPIRLRAAREPMPMGRLVMVLMSMNSFGNMRLRPLSSGPKIDINTRV